MKINFRLKIILVVLALKQKIIAMEVDFSIYIV